MNDTEAEIYHTLDARGQEDSGGSNLRAFRQSLRQKTFDSTGRQVGANTIPPPH